MRCIKVRPQLRTSAPHTYLHERQHRLAQQPVVGVSPEAQHRHAVVGLVQEGQGGVVHQHRATQVAAHPTCRELCVRGWGNSGEGQCAALIYPGNRQAEHGLGQARGEV